MDKKKAVIVSSDMVTPYGRGADACWKGIMSGRTAVSAVSRFDTKNFQSPNAATVDGLDYLQTESLVMQMIMSLLEKSSVSIPRDSRLMVATIKGEIDLMEKYFLKGIGDVSDCTLGNLLRKVNAQTGVEDRGIIVSAACASSTAAVARAAAMIHDGLSDCVPRSVNQCRHTQSDQGLNCSHIT